MSATRLTVETNGDFMLMDPLTGQVISSEGETEVEDCAFVQNMISQGKLTLIGKKVDKPRETLKAAVRTAMNADEN